MTSLTSSLSFLPCYVRHGKCYISVSPDTQETHEIGDEFLYEITNGTFVTSSYISRHPPEIKYFPNATALREDAFASPRMHAASVVFKDTHSYSDYSIYMNGYYLPSEVTSTNVFSSTFGFLSNASNFDTSGYSALQLILDEIIMRRSLKSLSKAIDNEDELPFMIQLMTKVMPGIGETITKMNFGSLIGLLVAAYNALSTVPLFAAYLIHLVGEKTAKTREYLFMMGLKKPVYWLSWFITFIVPSLLFVVCGLVLNYLVGAFKG